MLLSCYNQKAKSDSPKKQKQSTPTLPGVVFYFAWGCFPFFVRDAEVIFAIGADEAHARP